VCGKRSKHLLLDALLVHTAAWPSCCPATRYCIVSRDSGSPKAGLETAGISGRKRLLEGFETTRRATIGESTPACFPNARSFRCGPAWRGCDALRPAIRFAESTGLHWPPGRYGSSFCCLGRVHAQSVAYRPVTGGLVVQGGLGSKSRKMISLPMPLMRRFWEQGIAPQ
jgi:hypothetical protein